MFLKKLQEILGNFSGIIFELESINAAKNEAEKSERERRISFMKETAPERPIFPVSCLMLNLTYFICR